MHDVFTSPWVEAWVGEIRSSETYRRAAAGWEGSLALELLGDESRAVLLDLWHGECRSGRVASAEELTSADYVLAAELATWKRVLGGEIEPIFGLMSGKLKLRRGNLAKLTPYVTASKELVAAAARVPTHFPDEYGPDEHGPDEHGPNEHGPDDASPEETP